MFGSDEMTLVRCCAIYREKYDSAIDEIISGEE